MSDAFDAGAAAGRDITKLAVDCPYTLPDKTGQREAWLEGFSSTRSDVSPSSDPEHTAGAREPSEPRVAPRNAMHEG